MKRLSTETTRGPIAHRRLRANGVEVHVAEAGHGPLVLFLHGWPELWYSWRHQLSAFADAGYHAVAPDLRGYGDTDAPTSIESYSMRHMVGDAVALLDALGADRALVVGHDWGAKIAWACAETFGDRIAGVAALSVPYYPRGPMPPTQMDSDRGHFSFVRYFQTPGVAEAEFEANVRRTMEFFLCTFPEASAEFLTDLYRGRPADAGVLDGAPRADLPRWLSGDELDYYVRAYSRTGFRGGLNRYRNMDRDWAESTRPADAHLGAPALFIGGDRDPPVLFGAVEPMRRLVPNLHDVVILPDCGHALQQARPQEVTARLLRFARDVSPAK